MFHAYALSSQYNLPLNDDFDFPINVPNGI